MRHTIALAKREIISYTLSPVGYIVAFLFIFSHNYIFHTWLFTRSNDASEVMTASLVVVGMLVLFAVPFLTMGLLADEKRTGTIEMLMTAPVADWEVVMGKFLGAVILMACLLVPSLTHVVVVSKYGLPEWGPIISGYVGLGLLTLFVLSMGLFFSSISRSALVAVMFSFVASLGLFLMGLFVPQAAPVLDVGNVFANMLHYLFAFLRYASLNEHYFNFAYGMINSRDVVYFMSGTAFFLFLSMLAVESRKWR